MGHLKHSIHIDAPVDKVGQYTDDPNNWPTFNIGMSEPDKITGHGVGQEVEFTMLMAGMHGHQTVRTVEDRTEPDGSGHWRGELTGTSSGWQTWDFTPQDGGTLITMDHHGNGVHGSRQRARQGGRPPHYRKDDGAEHDPQPG